MALYLLFLLSCIITVIILDRKKMFVASVVYIAVFAMVGAGLLFAVDCEPIFNTLVRIFGAHGYFAIKYAFLDAASSPVYGAVMVGALALSFAMQLLAAVICPVQAIVRYILGSKPIFETCKRSMFKHVHQARSLFYCKDINLICCRMLN